MIHEWFALKNIVGERVLVAIATKMQFKWPGCLQNLAESVNLTNKLYHLRFVF
jgi:hypothetical protein